MSNTDNIAERKSRMGEDSRRCKRCGNKHHPTGFQGPDAEVCNQCLHGMNNNKKVETTLEYWRDRRNQYWLTQKLIA